MNDIQNKLNALPNKTKIEIMDIFCSLSPENLCCDGEISRSQVNIRYNKLMTQLKKLYTKIGFKFDELDIPYSDWNNL